MTWATARLLIVSACIGLLLAIASAAPHLNAELSTCKACGSMEGCPTCLPDECLIELYQWTEPTEPSIQVTRCVEYDGFDPSHCAIVTMTYHNIMEMTWHGEEVVGVCATQTCANGSVTSEECAFPWWAPWLIDPGNVE